MQNNPWDAFPATGAQPTTPGIIRGRPKQPTSLQISAEQRAQEDQAFQREKFEVERQKIALDIQKTQRDLLPGADTTEGEKTAGFLATRVAGGIGELKSIYKRNQSAQSPKLGVEITRGLFGDTAANYANDADRQQAEAAELDVLDAALTLGTGAAYTREQLIGYSKSYFPRLGDAPETIAAKQDRLVRLLEAAKVKAGRSAPMIDEALAAARAATDNEDPELVEFETNPNLVVGTDGRIYDKRTGQPVETPDPEDPNSLGQALYAGVGDVAEGVGDVLGLVGNPLNAGINAIAGTNLSTDLGQTFRQATGAPEGDPLASAINRSGVSALTGAGLAGAARPIATGVGRTVTNALAQEPIRQGIAGGAAGASSELARQSGANPLLQAAAGLAGGVGAFGATGGVNALLGASKPVATNSLVTDAARARVPLMTTDALPPKTVIGKSARKLGELIPIAGTAGPRTTQQESRVNAVKSLAREFEIDEASLDDVAKDLAKTRGNQIKTFKGQKDQILDSVTVPAPAPRAIAMLDKKIAKFKKVRTKNASILVAKLEDFKQALAGKTRFDDTGVIDPNTGQTIKRRVDTQPNTLKELEAIRREMGAAFDDPSLASIADDGKKAVRAIYSPLRNDMGAVISDAAGPDVARTWRVANARLSSMADELQSTALKSTLNKAASTPEDVAKLLFSAKPSQVRLLYNNLSSEGRVKAQGVLIGRALEKAGESPDKFANELDRLSKNVGIFFQDSDLARVQGLGRVLQATKRASQAGVQPENGAQLVPWAIPTVLTALLGFKGGVAGAGAFGIGARIYESAPVRNALLKLGRTKPGSPQEQGAMARAMTAIAAANDNPDMQAFMSNAPTSARAAATEGEQERK